MGLSRNRKTPTFRKFLFLFISLLVLNVTFLYMGSCQLILHVSFRYCGDLSTCQGYPMSATAWQTHCTLHHIIGSISWSSPNTIKLGTKSHRSNVSLFWKIYVLMQVILRQCFDWNPTSSHSQHCLESSEWVTWMFILYHNFHQTQINVCVYMT